MRIAIGTLVFFAAAVIFGVLAGIAFQGLSSALSAGVLLLAAACGGFAAVQVPAALAKDAPKLKTWATLAMFVVFGLAAGRAFLWLIYPDGDAIKILSPYNLGDLSLHIALIRYLASGVHFWPESPILSDSPLVYPVGMDMFNSLLLSAGIPLELGLIWCGIIGSALAAWALWRWGGAFAIAAFCFTGGLMGLAIFSDDWALRDFGADAEWKNAFLTMFVTQRNFLFVLPAGLVLLSEWRRMVRDGCGALPFWIVLVFYASMPLFSVHTFLFLSVCLVGVFFSTSSTTIRWQFFSLGVAALFPATFAVALVTGGFATSGSFRWHPGWMQNDASWTFWIWNFGLMIPLWVAVVWRVLRSGERAGLGVVMPATVSMLACFFFAFAPWPWDNTKIMIWCWLAITPWLWDLVISPMPLFARAPILFVLFVTGAISLMAGLDGRHGYSLASKGELAEVEAMLKNVPIDARIAVAPDFKHPVLLLGRKVAVGYPGHLWSHGLAYQAKEASLNRLMNARESWEYDASKLDVDYLFFGDREHDAFPESMFEWGVAVESEGVHGTLMNLNRKVPK